MSFSFLRLPTRVAHARNRHEALDDCLKPALVLGTAAASLIICSTDVSAATKTGPKFNPASTRR